jgi:hypothetical protein
VLEHCGRLAMATSVNKGVTLKKNGDTSAEVIPRVQATREAYRSCTSQKSFSSCACKCSTANAVVSFASVAYSRAMHATLQVVDQKYPLTGNSRSFSPLASSPSRTFTKRSRSSAPCTKIACQQRPDTGRPVWRQRTDQVGISAAEPKCQQ